MCLADGLVDMDAWIRRSCFSIVCARLPNKCTGRDQHFCVASFGVLINNSLSSFLLRHSGRSIQD